MDPTAIDNLDDQPQVREVSVMVATEGRLSEDKLAEVQKAVAAFVKTRPQWTPKALTLPWDTNETYAYEFLRGNLKAIPAESLQRLARVANEWAEVEHRREKRQTVRGFVHTRVVKRLAKEVGFAVETGDIVVAHGPAGCGKTATLLYLVQFVYLTALYLYVTPDCQKKVGFLRALYRAVYGHAAPSRVTLEDILVRLRGSGRPLFIDNADLLTSDTFPVLMALHDVAEIPIVIVCTHKVLERLTSDNDAWRGQMASLNEQNLAEDFRRAWRMDQRR